MGGRGGGRCKDHFLSVHFLLAGESENVTKWTGAAAGNWPNPVLSCLREALNNPLSWSSSHSAAQANDRPSLILNLSPGVTAPGWCPLAFQPHPGAASPFPLEQVGIGGWLRKATHSQRPAIPVDCSWWVCADIRLLQR